MLEKDLLSVNQFIIVKNLPECELNSRSRLRGIFCFANLIFHLMKCFADLRVNSLFLLKMYIGVKLQPVGE